MRLTFIAASALFCISSALAQSPPLRAELSPAAFLLGQWQGGGWIEFAPGQRREFRQSETITTKLGGGAIVIEGLGTRKAADGTEIVTHEALGIITYDANRKQPAMRAYRTGGQYVDPEISIEPRRMVWQFQLASGERTRYTITLSDKGEWLEIGELSKDGGDWRKFFEMTLSRTGGK